MHRFVLVVLSVLFCMPLSAGVRAADVPVPDGYLTIDPARMARLEAQILRPFAALPRVPLPPVPIPSKAA